MTTNEALDFLRLHQPLPPSQVISEELLGQFDEVRMYFAAHPDNRSVPLLLNAFGEGDGHGVYQLVENTILCHPESVVIPALKAGLECPHGSVRRWNAEIAANYRCPELVPPLVELLKHGNIDERYSAIIALGVIGTPEAKAALENSLSLEIELELKSAIREALGC